MSQITLDQTAIATTVAANIILSLSIQLQKYTKKQVLHLALHGVSTALFERIWLAGLAMLVIAECSYFLALGLSDTALQLTPIGVFTATSNMVLPPLFFEHRTCTIVGSLMCDFGILIMILVGPSVSYGDPKFDWDASHTKWVIIAEICFGILLVMVKRYRPANCSLKLGTNCAISSLMGSYSVMAIKIMQTIPEDSGSQPLLATVVLLSFVLEMVLLTESLQFFPVWQVVPHHFALFSSFVLLNSVTLFHQFDDTSTSSKALVLVAHFLTIVGVWTSAKPHLDIPANITHSGLLPEMANRVLNRWTETNEGSAPMDAEVSTSQLDTPFGHSCLQIEFGKMMHEILSQQESSITAL